MQLRKGVLIIVLGAMCAAIPSNPTMQVYAATKIEKVELRFEPQELDERGVPEIEVTNRGTHYAIGDCSNAYYYYGKDNRYNFDEASNLYTVELFADDGYYFNTYKDKIKVSGFGAQFVRAERKDNGQTFIVTVRLEDMTSFVSDISNVWWEQSGKGAWEEAYGATLYKVAVTDPKGDTHYAETAGCTYDFSPFMQMEGNYSFRVKPVAESGDGGEWMESGGQFVDAQAAFNNQSLYKVEKEWVFEGEEQTPDKAKILYKNIGWQSAADGRYWYRNQDGSYPQSVWMQDGETWYYFDAHGLMSADAYINWKGAEYYVGSDGAMLVNGKAPDGRRADENGILKKR